MFNRWTRIPAVILSAIALIILIFFLLHKSNRVEPFDLNQFCGIRPKPVKVQQKESHHVHYLFDSEDISLEDDLSIKDHPWSEEEIRGAYYMLVENTQLQKARESIRSLQDRQKNTTAYPWIILNSQKFTPSFKKYIRMAASPSTRIYFGQIDLEAWSFPYWIDSDRADNAMKRMLHYQIENAHSQYFHQLQRYVFFSCFWVILNYTCI